MADPPGNPTRWPWAALFLFFLVAYVGGYFVLSDFSQPVISGVPLTPLTRSVDFAWMNTVYKPL